MFILNGMVRVACSQASEVLMFVKKAYINSLRNLFGDLRNLRLKFVDEVHELYAQDAKLLRDATEAGYELLRIGVHTAEDWRALDPAWSRALYRQIGLDPKCMHTEFRAQRDTAKEDAMLRTVRNFVGDVYVVLHDDPDRGFVVDRSHLPANVPVVHVDDPRWKTCNIFDYVAVIDNAMEFHGFDSAFMYLASYLDLCRRKVCHAYVRECCTLDGHYRSSVTFIT
jgi:hypothetical protein